MCVPELRELVEVVKVWRCGGLPERWTDNLLLDAWESAGYDGPVSVHWCWKNATLSSFIAFTRVDTGIQLRTKLL